ncbi:MAG: methyltransferase domain-containing protein [Acidobacteria bacterium]|nr:methyltransferase domain-containing protein [Acidobacteriota bacterium]
MLLGDSFHPGGLRLTERLGERLGLRSGLRVLDVASGKGESAIFLAKRFGCEVVGIDFGAENVKESKGRASTAEVGHLVTFREGDAERIDFPDASFDAVICECAFCTFPDKRAAAGEFARVLEPSGKVGLSDLTRSGPLPSELEGLLAWVACIADARPVEEYAAYLEGAGISGTEAEAHDEALAEMVRDIQGKLLGAELMSKLKRIDLHGVDFAEAKTLARAAADAVRAKRLGYAFIVGQGG